jgi:huntingtin interacting protein 1
MNKFRQNVYLASLEHCENIIVESLHIFDDPVLLTCKSGAEYLLNQLQPFDKQLKELVSLYNRYSPILSNLTSDTHEDKDFNRESFLELIKQINSFTNLISILVVSGKITSITAAALEQGQLLADLVRQSGQISLELIEKMKKNENLENESNKLNVTIKSVLKNLNELLPKSLSINKEEIGDLVDQEMHNTSNAIEQAVAKLEALIEQSREKETGVKLEVNDKILDSCTGLMKVIKILIVKAKDLQKEIVAQGKGASSVKEFYSINHKWTEGLVSAAKLVGLGASVLIENADKLVNGSGKLEEIIVCSNMIAASTAQLVVASNVKANRESLKRVALMEAKTNVSAATANLVASAKSCSQKIDEQTSMDFTSLSLHQTKRLEMEAQVKVLELEKQLETEKNKLYGLRKQHYHLSGENE